MIEESPNIALCHAYIRFQAEQIVTLQTQINQLVQQNGALLAEIADLKAQIQQNSSNSHKPPSSDGYGKKKALTQIAPKGAKKSVGGQKGHTGSHLNLSTQVDVRYDCALPSQCACGARLAGVKIHRGERRQVFELPEIRLRVEEYVQQYCRCETCGARHQSDFPAYVRSTVQYGVRAQAWAVMFHQRFKLSLESVEEIFAECFQSGMQGGSIWTSGLRAYRGLAAWEAQQKADLRQAPVAHFDESGGRVAGKLHWFHTVSTAQANYLYVHPRRGKVAFGSEDGVLAHYQGWAVHDCLAGYFSFKDCKHAVCGAHLVRELQAQIDQGRQWAQKMQDLLLDLYQQSQSEAPIAPDLAEKRPLYHQIIAEGLEQEPPPEGLLSQKPRHSKGRNLLNRLQKYETAVLAFAQYPEVPFTNNQAERDLRPLKTKLKIAGCFRTLQGRKIYARIYSFVSTLKKQGKNILEGISQAILDSYNLAVDP
jgi:transposase